MCVFVGEKSQIVQCRIFFINEKFFLLNFLKTKCNSEQKRVKNALSRTLLQQVFKYLKRKTSHWSTVINRTIWDFHQLCPLGRIGLVVVICVCFSVCLSVCLSDVPYSCNFLCVVWLVQSMPCPWTGAILVSISILSRTLKTRMCSGVLSRSRSFSQVEP